MLIEQAIFTSTQTDRAEGYQLAGRSNGLSAADARELAVWGPSHDSLLEQPGEPASTNFHRLSSGSFCVSRTTLAGAEYSGRGGPQVYTQFLVVPPPLLARFSNNPFAILRAATASGALGVGEQIPEVLQPFRLSGGARPQSICRCWPNWDATRARPRWLPSCRRPWPAIGWRWPREAMPSNGSPD